VEPFIIINGKQCTASMAMTIRVAIECFALDLRENGLGDDDHGLKIVAGYLANIDLIRSLIFNHKKD